jgi:hypothetical protein
MRHKAILLAIVVAAVSARKQVPTFGPPISQRVGGMSPEMQFFTSPMPRDPVAIATDFVTRKAGKNNGFSFELKSHYGTQHNSVSFISV